ncbi:hypothetical protein AVEN_58294-1, partial [Araneus ventricosus]
GLEKDSAFVRRDKKILYLLTKFRWEILKGLRRVSKTNAEASSRKK